MFSRMDREDLKTLGQTPHPEEEAAALLKWDFIFPAPPFPCPQRQLSARLFLHLTFPLPGRQAPASCLQVIVSPAGMPKREVPLVSECPLLSQDALAFPVPSTPCWKRSVGTLSDGRV